MPKVTHAIQAFLNARRKSHNGPDLLDRWTPHMETQVNVARGKGEPVDGKKSTFTDGIDEWFSIRIPRNANSEPEFRDYELRFPLDEHAEAIGSTGWDWSSRRSRWVGFDFDSITGHAAGVGVTDEELEKVSQAAQALPYVEVRRSTGGKGLHLYVYFEEAGIPTANHTEHAALGRAVLGMMSSETNFDFASQIDACGGNMWMWHRKMSAENEGLKLLKPAERPMTTADLPANWRDHIEVVTKRRTKVRVGAVEEENQDPFEVLANSRRIVPLDEKHKKLREALQRSGFTCVWVSDHHLLQTHTKALENLINDPDSKKELGLVGFFKTSSAGKDPGTPNCFLFPLENGSWRVYRFSPGINEAETWTQDGDGWTTCYFNRRPDLDVAAKALGGREKSNGRGFAFDEARLALAVASSLGQQIHIPESMHGRETILKKNKDGRLVVEIKKEDQDSGMKGWDATDKKGFWVKVFNVQTNQKTTDIGCEYDSMIRSLVSAGDQDAGWVLKGQDGVWVKQSKDNIKSVLINMGNSKPEADIILGGAVLKGWKLVNIPFKPEYPGNRQWNMRAAQYRFKPAELADDQAPYHPHWNRVLNHCGQDLNSVLRNAPWAQRAGIKTGGDYLLYWIACMFREPFERLPYLFLFGGQNCGKSILHESIMLLMTRGTMSADKALTNKSDFNSELANAVLCYVEEKNVSKSGVYDKIKDYVTSPLISIHGKGKEIYLQSNTTHWIQNANKPDYCPIFDDDTRITMIYVHELAEDIPKTILLKALEDEAPHFMRTLLDLTLPPMEGRLRLPIVNTHHKQRAQEMSRDSLEQFIVENSHYVPGEILLFSEFYQKFHDWLAPDERGYWTKIAVSRNLSIKFPIARGTDNKVFIGNISWKPQGPEEKLPLIAVSGKFATAESVAA